MDRRSAGTRRRSLEEIISLLVEGMEQVGKLGRACKPATWRSSGCDDMGVVCRDPYRICMPRDIKSTDLSKLIKAGNLQAIQLIDHDTQINLYNFVDDDGNSPLMVAASTPDKDLIIYHILSKVNNIFKANRYNRKNALMLAFESNSERNVGELLNKIEDVSQINDISKENKTVLDYADESTIREPFKSSFIAELVRKGAQRAKRGGSLRSKTHKRLRKHNRRRSTTKQRKRRQRN